MKTKRLAAVLAALLALVCCAAAWGDVIEPGRPRLLRPIPPRSPREAPSISSEDVYLESMVSVDVWTTGTLEDGTLKLEAHFQVDGPGAYRHELLHLTGTSVLAPRQGVHRKFEELAFSFQLPCAELPAHYLQRASFFPFLYDMTSFGPKLVKGPDGCPLSGERQDLSHHIIVEEVSGDVRVRVVRLRERGLPHDGEVGIPRSLESLEEKPVIHLYPEVETDVTVRLDFKGALTCAYPMPEEDGAWRVTARPDGTLTDRRGREYRYLFWEGLSNAGKLDLSSGFVVRGKDTAEFLHEKLTLLGLTPGEANEFIVYWLPRMQENTWNLVSFQGENYTDTARLVVTPTPDTVLRVFMAYRPLDIPISLPPQELRPTQRRGFTLVEWGGAALRPASPNGDHPFVEKAIDGEASYPNKRQ